MKRFWISWCRPGADFRPICDPKKESEPFGHLYWCSGEAGDGSYFTMCAVVDAASEAKAKAAVNARKTHCIHGHPLCGENLRVRDSGYRECLTCKDINNKKRTPCG